MIVLRYTKFMQDFFFYQQEHIFLVLQEPMRVKRACFLLFSTTARTATFATAVTMTAAIPPTTTTTTISTKACFCLYDYYKCND